MDSHKSFIKLQIETERKSFKLANDMWQQQLELNKTHERTMQNSLNNISKLNRQLQDENDLLLQRNSEFALNYSSSMYMTNSSFGEFFQYKQANKVNNKYCSNGEY